MNNLDVLLNNNTLVSSSPAEQRAIQVQNPPGLTLLDYFAAKAMAVYMTDPVHFASAEKVATYAYKMADEMLRARPQS